MSAPETTVTVRAERLVVDGGIDLATTVHTDRPSLTPAQEERVREIVRKEINAPSLADDLRQLRVEIASARADARRPL